MKNIKGALELFLILIICILVAKFIAPLFILVGHVPSGSMIPTLEVGDKLVCTNVFWHDLEHGDIVVFKPSKEVDSEQSYWIKRLIGLPGDKVKIVHGEVYLNGELLEEDYVKSKLDYSGSFTVPDDKYFVLGDNRGDSLDARFWENPFIDKKQLKFVSNYRIYPFTRIGKP